MSNTALRVSAKGGRGRPLTKLAIASAAVSVLCLSAFGAHADRTSMMVTGICCAVTAGWAFAIDGRRRITPAGLYFLSTGVFVGIALVMLAGRGSNTSIAVLAPLGLALHGAALVSLPLYEHWRGEVTALTSHKRWRPVYAGDRGKAMAASLALCFWGLAFFPVTALGALPQACAYAGLCLAGAVGLTQPVSTPHSHLSWLPAAAGFVAYVARAFTGNGRLIVVGLGLALVVCYNSRSPKGFHKASILLLLGPALALAAVTQIRDPKFDNQRDVGRGIDSLYVIDTFAEIVDRDQTEGVERMHRQYGATFAKSAVIWVPRSMWPNKPLGFGAEIAEVLHPQYRAAGHSDAALFEGEFYVNFGWLGIAFYPFAIGYVLARMTRWHDRFVSLQSISPPQLLRFGALLSASVSLAELRWGGTFSWAARGGLGAALALALAAAFAGLHRGASVPSPLPTRR